MKADDRTVRSAATVDGTLHVDPDAADGAHGTDGTDGTDGAPCGRWRAVG
jgi:hypothetical protein